MDMHIITYSRSNVAEHYQLSKTAKLHVHGRVHNSLFAMLHY